MGKAPNDDQARAIMSAAQKVGDDGTAANALVRMPGATWPRARGDAQGDPRAYDVSGNGQHADQYADESNGKPDSFDISQLSTS